MLKSKTKPFESSERKMICHIKGIPAKEEEPCHFLIETTEKKRATRVPGKQTLRDFVSRRSTLQKIIKKIL